MRLVYVRDVLLEVAAILDCEDRYTPTAPSLARDGDGRPCGYRTERAEAFTLLGACKLAVYEIGVSGHRDRWKLTQAAQGAVEAHLACSRRVRGFYETEWRHVSYDVLLEALDNAILGNEAPVKPAEIALEELYLNPRTYNALHRCGFRDAGELVQVTREQLETIRNLGAKSVAEIDAALSAHGLRLNNTEATR